MHKALRYVACMTIVAIVALSAAACGSSATQAQLDKAREAQRRAETDLTKTKQELANVKAQLAEQKRESGGSARPSSGEDQSPSSSSVYTPPQGSATRQAILDAVRANMNWTKLFKVRSLRVKDGWAYGELQQYDPDKPGTQYEGFTALLHKVGGSWKVVWVSAGADIDQIEQSSGMTIEKWLQNKYGAPPEIFN